MRDNESSHLGPSELSEYHKILHELHTVGVLISDPTQIKPSKSNLARLRRHHRALFPFETAEEMKLKAEQLRLNMVILESDLTQWQKYEINSLIEAQKSRPASTRFFKFLELAARILPSRVRLQTFEPSFNDEKAAYLNDRRKYKSKTARIWLSIMFATQAAFMVADCFWGMLSDKFKRLILGFLPDIFRKILGR
jgi:hypothetical protein